MSYTGNYLKAHGQNCSILRTPAITSYVSMKRSSKSTTNIGIRDAAWEGLILADAGLVSGEVFSVGSNKYLIQSVDNDPASGEDIFFCVKANADLVHKRYKETVDENGNLVKEWQIITASVPTFGQIVTAQLRQFDPGLLPGTKYTFQVPKSVGVLELDRIIYGEGPNNKYQVDSIDDIASAGMVRLQASTDTRP